MAGFINSFSSGSNLEIKMGNIILAYGSISFSDDVQHGSVGGVGSYSYDADEPLSYLVRGNLTVTNYSTGASNAAGAGVANGFAPSRIAAPNPQTDGSDGNSLLLPGSFNPILLMISRTFDIVIYEKTFNPAVAAQVARTPAYTIQDAVVNSFNVSVQSSQLVQHQVGFLAIKLIDHQAQA